jgi:hypothetical protein
LVAEIVVSDEDPVLARAGPFETVAALTQGWSSFGRSTSVVIAAAARGLAVRSTLRLAVAKFSVPA